MKTLNITLKGASKLSPNVLVDGEFVKLKKNQFGNYIASIETEKSEVDLVIQKYHELSGNLWFLMSVLFFVISLFGLFDIRYGKNNCVIDSKFHIKLNEDVTHFVATMDLNKVGSAITFESNAEINEELNVCFEDEVVKKRKKILLATKIILWLLLIGVALYFLIKSF